MQKFFPILALSLDGIFQLYFCESPHILKLSLSVVGIVSIFCLHFTMHKLFLAVVECLEDFVELGVAGLAMGNASRVELAGSVAEKGVKR